MERVDEAEPLGVSGWDVMLHEYAKGWRDKDYQQFATLFRLSQLRGSVLDVGCAVGDGFDVLQRSARRATRFSGCDFSREGINAAARRFPEVDLFVHDIHEPLPGRWEVVMSLQTIEHLDDPATAVARMDEAASNVLIVAAPYRNRRPDRDHKWSFDESDFRGVFDGWVIDRAERNIYWYRSSVDRLARPLLEVMACEWAAAARRRRWHWTGRAR